MRMWSVLLATLTTALLVLSTAPRTLGQAKTFTSSVRIPLDPPLVVEVPCAEELVEISGDLHVTTHVTLDSNGGFHSVNEVNPQGVDGTGLTSGKRYRGTGVTRTSLRSAESTPVQLTFVNSFRIVGEGPDNNLLVHENIHLTIFPDGSVTASVDNFSLECR